MIEKLLAKMTKNMQIDQEFDEEDLTLIVRTWYGENLVSEHVTDMEPMFRAFEKRLNK